MSRAERPIMLEIDARHPCSGADAMSPATRPTLVARRIAVAAGLPTPWRVAWAWVAVAAVASLLATGIAYALLVATW